MDILKKTLKEGIGFNLLILAVYIILILIVSMSTGNSIVQSFVSNLEFLFALLIACICALLGLNYLNK